MQMKRNTMRDETNVNLTFSQATMPSHVLIYVAPLLTGRNPLIHYQYCSPLSAMSLYRYIHTTLFYCFTIRMC